MALLLAASLAMNFGLIPLVVHLGRSQQRCLDYAWREAERREVTDPAGQAYSDMATVIVLDGDVA